MATMKRCSYVSDSDSSSYEDGDMDVRYKQRKHNSSNENIDYHYRRTKCSSRNAIMARENRIKKKLYMQKLEQEVKFLRKDNSRLNVVVDSQSFKISELQKRIKYMESVLANSGDLRLLMKNIQCSTGMSVTTSLDKTLTLNNDCVPKHERRFTGKTALSWSDQLGTSIETIEAECETHSNLNSFSEFDIFNEDPFPDLLVDLGSVEYKSDTNVIPPTLDSDSTRNEHNYTLTSKYLSDENGDSTMNDVGVCLHVSKHRVSLEFCSSCSDNAIETWKTVE